MLPTTTRSTLLLRGRHWRWALGAAASGLLLGTPALAQTPTLTALSPTRNSVAAARTAPVAATFSQALRPDAGTQQALRVFSQQAGGRKAGTATVSGNTLTFDPTTDFKAGETLFATVTTAVQSSSGQNLATGQVLQFTTATSPSTGRLISQQTGAGATLLGDLDGDGDLDVVDGAALRLNDGTGTFGASQPVPVASTQGATLGDVDGDGDLDLLAVNTLVTGTVSVRLNDGSGRFSGTQEVAVSNYPVRVILGDVDADGDLDLLARGTNSTATASIVSVRLNNGFGLFSGNQEVVGTPGSLYQPFGTVLGDIDSDGDLDLLTTNSNNNTVNVRRNDGSGTFGSSQDVAVDPGPYQTLLSDLDGDGDLDLLVAARAQSSPTSLFFTGRVTLYRNNGSGTFGSGQLIALDTNPSFVNVGDIEGDGDLDLLTTYTGFRFDPAEVTIHLNNGAGAFTVSSVVESAGARDVLLGDVDQDGDLDCLTGAAVLLNQNLPTITQVSPSAGAAGTVVTVTGTNLRLASTLTLNGVPVPGFVVNSATQLTFTVPLGATSGTLTVITPVGTSSIAFTVPPPTLALAVTGLLPARHALGALRTTNVAANFSQPLSNTAATQQALRVFSQQAGGKKAGTATISGNILTFNPTTNFQAGETVSATLTTAVQSSSGQPLVQGQVFQFTTATSPSAGTFGSPQDLTTNAPTRSVALGDVDGDGDNDLLTANNSSSSGSTVSVRLNNGSGVYGAVVQEVTAGSALFDIALADLDADGDLDLVTASYTSATVQVRLNNGAGIFASSGSEVAVSVFPAALTTGDVDQDGNLDILVSTLAGNVDVLLGNSSGTFAVSRPVSGVGGVIGGSCVALGDVDNDGDLDLLVTYNTTITGAAALVLQVCLNNGQGMFSPTGPPLPLGSASYKVALGDVDNDGDLDVVASTGLYRNQGNGTFAGTPQPGVGETVLGDIDGDGDLDWLLGNGQAVAVRLNNGSGTFTSSQPVSVGGTLDLALSDLDNNGTLDLVAVADTTASVRLNQALSGLPPTTIRLNAGGGTLSNTTQGVFSSDQYYAGPSSVFTKLVPIAGTLDDALYQSERYSTQGQLRYAVPVANGLYTVVLHFAELYWTQAGQRVFNIGLEGNTVRTNYDIVAKVGPLTATTETYQVQVTDGVLNLDLVVPYLSGGRDQAKLSALEILPALTTYRLNAGGPAQSTSLGLFAANQEAVAGSAVLVVNAPIAGTLNAGLYQSERYSTHGQLSYALPVVNGPYSVVLHFAEIYWTQPGQRVFNINLEGNTVRTNYDIVAKVGPLTATTETFTVTVTDGLLNLDLVVPYGAGGADQAKLSALEVVSGPGSTRPLAATPGPTASGAALQVYPTPVTQGRFTLAYTAAQAQAGTLTLFDQLGRTVHEQPLQLRAGFNQVVVQPAALRAGLYQLVLCTADGQRRTQKVVVQ